MISDSRPAQLRESRREVLAKGIALSILGNIPVFAKENSQLLAACVKVDITPDVPQWLHGYAPRQSNGVRDRIFHRVLGLSFGDQVFYIASTDVCTISTSFFNQFRRQLEQQTGIPEDRFWWSTTHTHSAPHLGPQELSRLFQKTLGDRFSIDHDQAYWERVQTQLTDAILDVKSKLKPAKISIGIGTADANVNRRQKNPDGKVVLGVNPTGPVDRQLNVVRVDDIDGAPIGLIANYAIHGTTFNGSNQKISGDVMGIVAKYVEDELGVPMLFVNGAEGNVAPRYSVGGEIESPMLGRYISLLGDPILKIAKRTSPVEGLRLSTLDTAVVSPRNESLQWTAESETYLSTAPNGTKQVKLPIFSLLLGKDTIIWAAPVELFSEIAIDVRRQSPFKNTLYFGLTNGSFLYVPTAAAFVEGGYEPNVSIFTPAIEKDLTAVVLDHLRKHYSS